MAKTSDRHPGGRPRSTPLTPWGRKVERLMIKRGFTRQDLANEIGISYVSLRALLIGENDPRLATFKALAAALKVPMDRLS